MEVDGKKIAADIFDTQRLRVEELKKNGVAPHLAVILVGDDQASKAYVRQKQIKGEAVGIQVTVHTLAADTTEKTLISLLTILNKDKAVHGIIVQQPLPKHISPEQIVEKTDPAKDVDGFHTNSAFSPPVAEAVICILKEIHSHILQSQSVSQQNNHTDKFIDWIRVKKVVILGKGETGGKPVAEKLSSLGVPISVLDSRTTKPEMLTLQADILISCVGKQNILTKDGIKKGSILLSVGMSRGDDGKLHGDYEEEDIKHKAAFYTPVPGGVGPVNVAMLLQNVIHTAKRSLH